MAAEDCFGITIENSEAEKMLMPRDLIDCVMRKVGYTDHAQCLTQRAFHRLRTSLMQQFSLKRDQIKPDVMLAKLFSKYDRRKQSDKSLMISRLSNTSNLSGRVGCLKP